MGTLSNVTESVRANLELFQLSGTSLQNPCATPGMYTLLWHVLTYQACQSCDIQYILLQSNSLAVLTMVTRLSCHMLLGSATCFQAILLTLPAVMPLLSSSTCLFSIIAAQAGPPVVQSIARHPLALCSSKRPPMRTDTSPFACAWTL